MGKLIDFKNIQKFEIKNKTETSADILLYDEIGESMWGGGISAKAFSDELKKLPNSIKQINLRINSPGGSVFDGMAIYQRLKEHPAKVTAYVDGISASIASVIMMAADEIVMGDGALVMIHKPLTGIYGNANELEKTIDILDKIENQMVSIYAKRTGASRIEISKMLSEETWFNSVEAVDFKLADKTFEAKDTLKLVASCVESCKWMKNKPQIKSSDVLAKEKLKELTNKVNSFLNSSK
jgi:ATP-dependent Clp endopeptidase proteolytic subunit ClpP